MADFFETGIGRGLLDESGVPEVADDKGLVESLVDGISRLRIAKAGDLHPLLAASQAQAQAPLASWYNKC